MLISGWLIGYELGRNIGLALGAIFTVILVLLSNIKITLTVFLTVVLTLVDIIGFLHFWGITIDIISCVNIVLAVGLCVDYSVHIAHAFLVAEGKKLETTNDTSQSKIFCHLLFYVSGTSVSRTISSLNTIGSAVFNGGFTTFLALVLLGFSTSHVFISFFKVFSLTVVFGLYHGLILLPVLLCVLGPSSQHKSELTPIKVQGITNNVFVSDNLK